MPCSLEEERTSRLLQIPFTAVAPSQIDATRRKTRKSNFFSHHFVLNNDLENAFFVLLILHF